MDERLIPAALVVLAFLLRLGPVLRGGGLRGLGNYDDGVYYGAAVAIVDGRVPYRDFVLLHPPGLPYLVLPFAALGRVVGEANGWVIARVCFMALAAAGAALSYAVARRFGCVSAILAGLTYACWEPALHAENTTSLEIPQNVLILMALLLIGRPDASPTNREERHGGGRLQQLLGRGQARFVLAGAALGLSACVKIWGVVPLVVIAIWQLLVGGPRRVARLAVGAAVAGILVCGPTLVLAPGPMVRMVIEAQLTRAASVGLASRAVQMFGGDAVAAQGAALGRVQVAGLIFVLVGALALSCLLTPGARIFAVLLGVEVLLLLASPPYYSHYATILTPALSLVAGVGAGRLVAWRTRIGRVAAVAAAGGVAAVAATQMGGGWRLRESPVYPAAVVAPFVSSAHCVAADMPSVLILSGILTRNIEHGCPLRIDFTGATYVNDRVVGAHGVPVSRTRNSLWQRDMASYLTSEPVAVLARGIDGISAPTWRLIYRRMHRVAWSHGVLVLVRLTSPHEIR